MRWYLDVINQLGGKSELFGWLLCQTAAIHGYKSFLNSCPFAVKTPLRPGEKSELQHLPAPESNRRFVKIVRPRHQVFDAPRRQ